MINLNTFIGYLYIYPEAIISESGDTNFVFSVSPIFIRSVALKSQLNYLINLETELPRLKVHGA